MINIGFYPLVDHSGSISKELTLVNSTVFLKIRYDTWCKAALGVREVCCYYELFYSFVSVKVFIKVVK